MTTQHTISSTSTLGQSADFQWPSLTDCIVIGVHAVLPLLLAGILVAL
jgi:hypothetical protein